MKLISAGDELAAEVLRLQLAAPAAEGQAPAKERDTRIAELVAVSWGAGCGCFACSKTTHCCRPPTTLQSNARLTTCPPARARPSPTWLPQDNWVLQIQLDDLQEDNARMQKQSDAMQARLCQLESGAAAGSGSVVSRLPVLGCAAQPHLAFTCPRCILLACIDGRP